MNWAMYALMAADAYNLQNASGEEIANLRETITTLFGYETSTTGVGTNQAGEPDSVTYSHASGLQLNVYENSTNQKVVAFRGTEFGRAGVGSANGSLDEETLAAWVHSNDVFAAGGNLYFDTDGVRVLAEQCRAAIDYVVNQVLPTIQNGGTLRLTGHSLGGALAGFVTIYLKHELAGTLEARNIAIETAMIDPAPFESDELMARAAWGFPTLETAVTHAHNLYGLPTQVLEEQQVGGGQTEFVWRDYFSFSDWFINSGIRSHFDDIAAQVRTEMLSAGVTIERMAFDYSFVRDIRRSVDSENRFIGQDAGILDLVDP